MRYRLVLPLVAVLALGACGRSGEDAGGEAAEEMAAAVEEGPTPQAGQYRTTAELLEFNLPGAPAEVTDMMRTAFAEGAAQGNEYCLTPEQAEANSREQVLKNLAESDCTVSRFDMSGGRFDAALSCPTGEGASGDVTMAGTMNETGSDVEMTFKTQVPEMGEATIRMRLVSERVGECA